MLASAIAALCFKRSEGTTAAAAKPGSRGLCAARWSQGKAVDELRNPNARLTALWAGVLGLAEPSLPLDLVKDL